MKDSLTNMNGYIGLGSKALKICNAVPKPKGATTTGTTSSTTSTVTNSSADYSQYYDPTTYWQNYASWQTAGYYDQTSETQSTESYMVAAAELKKDDDLELIGILLLSNFNLMINIFHFQIIQYQLILKKLTERKLTKIAIYGMLLKVLNGFHMKPKRPYVKFIVSYVH